MRNIKLVLSYDGTDFSGWQTQPTGFRTVQSTLQDAIFEVIGEKVHANASGRTDAGVHAAGQVVNFLCESLLGVESLFRAVATKLPEDVCLRGISEVPLEFDANRHAIRKLYRYVIIDGPFKNPFMRKYAFRCKHRLDASLMAEAAVPLKGTHDFRSFETNWPNRFSSVRTVNHLTVNRVGQYVWIDIEANGFLYNMVRTIAGTLVNIGRGFWPVESMKQVLEAQDRSAAGMTSAPEGLYLMRVTYE